MQEGVLGMMRDILEEVQKSHVLATKHVWCMTTGHWCWMQVKNCNSEVGEKFKNECQVAGVNFTTSFGHRVYQDY